MEKYFKYINLGNKCLKYDFFPPRNKYNSTMFNFLFELNLKDIQLKYAKYPLYNFANVHLIWAKVIFLFHKIFQKNVLGSMF